MLLTLLSKSKSKPSTTALPKGRGAPLLVLGPNIEKMLSAAAVAAADDAKPPSEYVAPPMESRIVFP